jgi:hypothetical protein
MSDTLQFLVVTAFAAAALLVLKRAYWPRRPAGPQQGCSNCASETTRHEPRG